MSAWRERNERALKALRPLGWSRGLVARVDALGISPSADDTLFELRYAHDLARARVAPLYEHRTGVGNSTVDFKLPGTIPWLVELVSIRESDAMRAATVKDAIAPGIQTETLFLSSTAGLTDPSRAKQTQQHELLRVVHKLGEKVYDGKKPIKFPVPDGSAFHMLLVDMRGFEGLAAYPDRDHCRQIAGGPSVVRHELNIAAHADTGEPIRGVWDNANSAPAAVLLRERVHVIGFVHEGLYCDDEIRDVTFPLLNPALFPDKERFHDLYPLAAERRLDLPARIENSLWSRHD
ncbi:MAG: hypothetical protein ABUS79_08730 [Pseudomonadota bacterium]